jgi:hypothetical protein
VRVATDQPVPRSGIYLPDCDQSCAELLIQGHKAVEARKGRNPDSGHALERIPATWTLVERIADEGGGPAEPLFAPLRCEAGYLCPQAGYWFTPAAANSRCYFKGSEPMPVVNPDWGINIWQWDENQEP